MCHMNWELYKLNKKKRNKEIKHYIQLNELILIQFFHGKSSIEYLGNRYIDIEYNGRTKKLTSRT